MNTTLAGNNMTLFSYTGYECNVIEFHYDLKSMYKIPVVMSVIAYYDPISGTAVMFISNQALWFGISMGKSLISNNQVQLHGIQLAEYPCDQNRPLGIVDHDPDWYINFTVKTYFYGVETRAPTI